MFSWIKFEKVPIVGIIRNISSDAFERILPLYAQVGFTTIEVTMNTLGAESMIRKAKAVFGDSINIGAGTVCNLSDLQKALDAGADFIVTPIVVADVILKCVANDVPVFPGAFSPTEIYTENEYARKYLIISTEQLARTIKQHNILNHVLEQL
jgi:2-dehydro-3-deoxyphosphogluconate aldolase/(4S)-4-hydroxy-2-oxoglutarate aldolase